MSFFVVFVLATILLDLTKPIDFSPVATHTPTVRRHKFSTPHPETRHTLRIRWAR